MRTLMLVTGWRNKFGGNYLSNPWRATAIHADSLCVLRRRARVCWTTNAGDHGLTDPVEW